MPIKISVVEKKVVETVNQYNIDEYYINESYGSIERFNQIVNGETLKDNEKPLVDFLGEIRPNNILQMQPKDINNNFKIKYGY
tara:strand:- start:279 stop:527 length:249 start_codon:yes stop_codon:yes gene_type:complete